MVGRPESELEDDGTPQVQLALALRALRRTAGNPSYRSMGKVVHRSSTTLSQAAGGERLPTWDTVLAYVMACGGTPDGWRDRWEAAAGTAQAPVSVPEPAPEDQPDTSAPPAAAATSHRPAWLWPAVTAAGAALAVGGFLVGTVTASSEEPDDTAEAAEITIAIRDGTDPQDTGCARLPGVRVLDTTEIDQGGIPVGVAQLKHSPGCGGSWPRFEPFPDADIDDGTVVHVDIVRPAADDERWVFSAPYVGAPTFGNLVVSGPDCVYAAVRLESPTEPSVESRTHCFRGATFVQ